MKGRVIRLAAAAVLSALVLFGQWSLAGQAARLLPEAVLMRQPEGFLLNAGELSEASKGGVPLSEPVPVTLTTGVERSKAVSLQAVGSGYGALTGLEIVRGTDLAPDGTSTVLIPETLARDVYLTADLIGAQVRLDGKTYLVGGVYREEMGLLSQMSRGDRETVYRLIDSRETPTGLLLSGQGKSADQLQQELNQTAQRKIPVAQVQDYRPWRSFAGFLGRLTGYWLVLAAAAVLFYLAAVLWRRTAEVWRGVRRITRPAVLLGAGVLALAAAAAALAACTAPALEMPAELLPKDNIFDLGHYFQWIIARTQAQNTAATGLWDAALPRLLSWQGILMMGNLLLAALLALRTCKVLSPFVNRD